MRRRILMSAAPIGFSVMLVVGCRLETGGFAPPASDASTTPDRSSITDAGDATAADARLAPDVPAPVDAAGAPDVFSDNRNLGDADVAEGDAADAPAGSDAMTTADALGAD